jgi:1-phosphofructokinase
MILTVTPNPSLDWTLRIPALVPGEVHRASAHFHEPSGKGVNISRALTVNTIASHAVLPLDGENGAELGRLLRQERIGYTAVPIADAVRTNVSLTEPGGIATKINTRGPTLTPQETGRLLEEVARHARRAAWVVGSGSLPRGVPDEFYAELGRLAHDAGARFALDSSGAALTAGLSAAPDLVKPNLDELAEATGRPVVTVADVVAAARELAAAGARRIAVSLGAEGALMLAGETVVHATAGVPHVESTVGAGDALLAGLLAGSRSPVAGPAEVLREGVAWASAAVAVEGSRVPVVTDAHRACVRMVQPPDPQRAVRRDTRQG